VIVLALGIIISASTLEVRRSARGMQHCIEAHVEALNSLAFQTWSIAAHLLIMVIVGVCQRCDRSRRMCFSPQHTSVAPQHSGPYNKHVSCAERATGGRLSSACVDVARR
jgi:hypothetical protein